MPWQCRHWPSQTCWPNTIKELSFITMSVNTGIGSWVWAIELIRQNSNAIVSLFICSPSVFLSPYAYNHTASHRLLSYHKMRLNLNTSPCKSFYHSGSSSSYNHPYLRPVPIVEIMRVIGVSSLTSQILQRSIVKPFLILTKTIR